MKSSSPGVIGGRNRTSRVDVGGNTEYLKGINASSRRLSSRGLTRRVSPHVRRRNVQVARNIQFTCCTVRS